LSASRRLQEYLLIANNTPEKKKKKKKKKKKPKISKTFLFFQRSFLCVSFYDLAFSNRFISRAFFFLVLKM